MSQGPSCTGQGRGEVKPLQVVVLWQLRCLQAPGNTQRWRISAGNPHRMLGLGWRCQPHADVPGPQGADAGSKLLPALCPAAGLAKRGQAGVGSAESSAEVHLPSACWCWGQQFFGSHSVQSPELPTGSTAQSCPQVWWQSSQAGRRCKLQQVPRILGRLRELCSVPLHLSAE